MRTLSAHLQGTPGVVGPLRLPAGTWALDVSGQLNSTSDGQKTVACRLATATQTVDQTSNVNLATANTPGSEYAISLTGALDLAAPAEVRLTCTNTTSATVTVRGVVIRAIRVASLEEQTD